MIKEPKVKAVKKEKVVKEKRKYTDKITLEEFWDEAEDDPVKMSQISKKLLSAISYEDRKRLNHQDLQDLKEIQ